MSPESQGNHDILQYFSKFLPSIPFLLILAGLIFVVYSITNPVTDPFTPISAISAFFTVVLTGLYVVVNSKQLDVMQKQLNEMKSDRELQNQPLPCIYDLSVSIEKPRLFYTPPTKHFSAHSRYNVNFVLKNVGSFPAVCTDISSYLILPTKEKNITNAGSLPCTIKNDFPDLLDSCIESSLVFESTAIRIDALEDKEIYPADLKKKINFLFPVDYEGILLKKLINGRNHEYPILKIRIMYKNVLGACFVLYNMYQLYPKYVDDQIDPVLRNWLSQIVSFPINYNNEVDKLRTFKESRKDDEYQLLFNQVKMKFNDSLTDIYSKDELELRVIPVPGYFTIKLISNEEYIEATKDISYAFAPF